MATILSAVSGLLLDEYNSIEIFYDSSDDDTVELFGYQ